MLPLVSRIPVSKNGYVWEWYEDEMENVCQRVSHAGQSSSSFASPIPT